MTDSFLGGNVRNIVVQDYITGLIIIALKHLSVKIFIS